MDALGWLLCICITAPGTWLPPKRHQGTDDSIVYLHSSVAARLDCDIGHVRASARRVLLPGIHSDRVAISRRRIVIDAFCTRVTVMQTPSCSMIPYTSWP